MRFRRDVLLYAFCAQQKASPKGQRPTTLADKAKKTTLFGRRWLERRGAGEEKEDGLLRTRFRELIVDC